MIQTERFNQKKPASPAWKAWRRFLKTITKPNGRLQVPLRRWTATYEECRRYPKFIHDPGEDIIYKHHSENQYLEIPKTQEKGIYRYPENLTYTSKAVGYPVHALDLGNTIRPLFNYTQHKPKLTTHKSTFAAFVADLPKWERELLTTIEMHDNPGRIMRILNEKDFYIGTDGSVLNKVGSYGYVGKSHDHVSLFRGRGPVSGTNPTSFRAETYGALTAYRFLIRLSEYTEVPLTSNCIHYIDNSSVVKRLQQEQQQNHHGPNQTLKPDWDVISMAAQSLTEIPTKIHIKWIKGHQDTQKPRHKLSRAAQVNCEADDQAGLYQREDNSPKNHVPIFPTTEAQLTINNKCINSYYTARIHEAATIPPLMQYHQERFRWTAGTIKTIDWETYKQIISLFRGKQTTLVKHLHKIAPTGDIAHRNDPHQTSQCPCCPQDPETNDHILQCRAASREKWRTKILRNNQQYLTDTLQSDPFLCDILRDGLQRWHNNLPPIDTQQYPETYHTLITNQNEIGWEQLYRARWCKQWSEHHHQYAIRKGMTNQNADGSTWVRKIGRRLLTQWFDLWQMRDKERHGRDIEEQKKLRQHKLSSETEELYQYRNQTMPTDRGMYSDTIEDHIQYHKTQAQQEEWISLWGSTIRASMKQAQTTPTAPNTNNKHDNTVEPH